MMRTVKTYCFWFLFLITQLVMAQVTSNAPSTPSYDLRGIAIGSYSNHTGGIFPLLASTTDNGTSWEYPTDIFENLKKSISPQFTSGILSGAACSNSKNLCIAPGQWCNGAFYENARPLIAVSNQKLNQWIYPKSVFKDLKKIIDPHFRQGSLTAGACLNSENSVCIASGVYYTYKTYFPLLALSSKKGEQWRYPRTIFKHPKLSIDPAFVNGYFSTASCTSAHCDNICIATGNFCSDNNCQSQFPLLALSKNEGKSWVYPKSIFKYLKKKVNPKFKTGFFISSSCTDKGKQAICIAAGSYATENGSTFPLLSLTQDGGKTWFYPPDIHKEIFDKMHNHFIGGLFNAASCTGVGKTARCIASGSLFTKSGGSLPFLALSRNGGNSWTYPSSIYTNLKTTVDPQFAGGVFDGASCIGNGTSTVCMAAGNYCNNQQACFPLLAVTTDGGNTWAYPPSIFSNLHSVIDENYRFGFFSNISCQQKNDQNLCIAVGQYSNLAGDTLPLLSVSTDEQNWTYPPNIFENLTSTINPDFAIGSFNKVATSNFSKLKRMGNHS